MPSEEMESLRSGESAVPIREIAHVVPMSWQQAYDEGVITYSDLSREQQAQVQADVQAQHAREAERELKRRQCLAEHGEHAWYVNLEGGYPVSIGCGRCGADAPVGAEDDVTVSLPVELHRRDDGVGWVVSPRLP